MSFDQAIQRFMRTFTRSKNKAIEEWEAVERTYTNNGGHEKSFQEWVLQQTQVPMRMVDAISQLQHGDHYENQKIDVRILIDRLVNRLKLKGHGILYLVLGERVMESRRSLEALIRVKKMHKDVTINELLPFLIQARNTRNGQTLILDDVRRAEAAFNKSKTAVKEDQDKNKRSDGDVLHNASIKHQSVDGLHSQDHGGSGDDNGHENIDRLHDKSNQHADGQNRIKDGLFDETDGNLDDSDGHASDECEVHSGHGEGDNGIYPDLEDIDEEKDEDCSAGGYGDSDGSDAGWINLEEMKSDSLGSPEVARHAHSALRDLGDSINSSFEPRQARPATSDRENQAGWNNSPSPQSQSGRSESPDRYFQIDSRTDIIRYNGSEEESSKILSGHTISLSKSHLLGQGVFPPDLTSSAEFEMELGLPPISPNQHAPSQKPNYESGLQLAVSSHQSIPVPLDSKKWGTGELRIGPQILRKKDTSTLGDGKWLNDEIINGCVTIIVELSRCRVYGFSSFFFKKLAGSHVSNLFFDYEAVKRWTKKVDIFAFDFVAVPIHREGNHWSLAVITGLLSLLDGGQSLIITMDNLDPEGKRNRQIVSTLSKYISTEAERKLKVNIEPERFIWKHARDVPPPEKTNTWDCGVYLLLNLERFLRDPKKLTKSLKLESYTSFVVESQKVRNWIRCYLFRLLKDQQADRPSHHGYSGYPALYRYSPQSSGLTSPTQPYASPATLPPAHPPQAAFYTVADNRRATPASAGHGNATTEDVLEAESSNGFLAVNGLNLDPPKSREWLSQSFARQDPLISQSYDAPSLCVDPVRGIDLPNNVPVPAQRTAMDDALEVLLRPDLATDVKLYITKDLNDAFLDIDMTKWQQIAFASGAVDVSKLIFSLPKASVSGVPHANGSQSPKSCLKHYHDISVSAVHELADQLQLEQTAVKSVDKIRSIIQKLVSGFEALLAQNKEEHNDAELERQGQQDLFSTGLPGPAFDFHRKKWLSDVEDRIHDLGTKLEDVTSQKDYLNGLYLKTLVAQRFTTRWLEALAEAVEGSKKNVKEYLAEEEKSEQERMKAVKRLRGLME